VIVVKGEPVLLDDRTDTIINPLMIVEVLSKSTKNYYRGDKFDYYRSIPEFLEYILIAQYKVYVEQFIKTSLLILLVFIHVVGKTGFTFQYAGVFED
jgi:Uma2 family endonuclease